MRELVTIVPLVLAQALAPTSVAAPGSTLVAARLASPAGSPSRLPRLFTHAGGTLGLSWVEPYAEEGGASGAILRISRLNASGWAAPLEVARGTRWFVNWADFPSVASLGGDRLVAHYLERSGEGSYDYHVRLVVSADLGKSWGEPVRLHDHAGAGEHGFVSIVPGPRGAAAVWLDGRFAAAHGGHGGDAGGATALFARSLGTDGALSAETVLDERVCDCCPTAAVRAEDGVVVVAYRDRSGEEVRDVTVLRWKEGEPPGATWQSGERWKIAGCPVNGPALAVAGGTLGLAWFTQGAEDRSRVLCAFSKDGGKSFSTPLELAGARAQGRVDAVFDPSGRLVVSWLEFDGERTQWHVARLAADQRSFDRGTVAEVSGGRDSGIGRLARDPLGVVFAWTEPGEEPRIAACRLRWE